MIQAIDLRELAGLRGPERAFLSLYCSGPDGLASLGARERRVRALLSDEPAEAEHFSENMRLVRDTLRENELGEGPGAFCLFACYALDFVRGYRLPVAVPDLLRVGPAPYIRPLAELQDEREDFLVVVADNQAARIIRVTSAAAADAGRVRGDVKNAVKVGGWSQQRYARRREKQLLHYAKEVGEALAELCRDGTFSRVVLLGSAETLREIESVLPPAVAAKVVGSQSVDLHAEDRTLLEQAHALYFDEERGSEERLWERIRSEYLRGGLAAAGPEDVLKATATGRVEAMIVARDARIPGTRCRDCENVAAGRLEACPTCGSGSVFALDLVDELARQLELTSATSEFADPIPGLTELGGVAALLRY